MSGSKLVAGPWMARSTRDERTKERTWLRIRDDAGLVPRAWLLFLGICDGARVWNQPPQEETQRRLMEMQP